MTNPVFSGEVSIVNPLTSELELCLIHAASGSMVSVNAEVDFESVQFGNRVRIFGSSVVKNAIIGPDSVLVGVEISDAKLGIGVLLGIDTVVRGSVENDEPPLLIDDYTTVDGSSITGKSCVGSDTRIGNGVNVVDSIIGSRVRIRDTKAPEPGQPPYGIYNQTTVVIGSIIGDGSDLGSNSFTQFCMIGSDVVVGELAVVTADLKDCEEILPYESRYRNIVIRDPIELPKPSRFARFRKPIKP